MATRGFRSPAPRGTGIGDLLLDESQAAVLTLADGESAAVLGAPGTGKTTTLVEVLAERVHERGYATDEVLALTASRTSATRLRDRIALRLDVPTNGPLARTATSLAFQLVGERARSNAVEPPRLLTGGEQDQIIAELLAGHIEDGTGPAWPEPLVDDVRALRGFRTELRELMARCVEHGVTPARLIGLASEGGLEEWRAAADFIVEYQRVVDSYRGNFVDSAELVAEAVSVVAQAGALGRLRLILVDDLQEATVATLSLLRAFADRGVAVVAFGDPDVAATTFRGAEPSALGRLDATLGIAVERHVLTTCAPTVSCAARTHVADHRTDRHGCGGRPASRRTGPGSGRDARTGDRADRSVLCSRRGGAPRTKASRAPPVRRSALERDGRRGAFGSPGSRTGTSARRRRSPHAHLRRRSRVA